MKLLVDTNIIIYHANGDQTLSNYLDKNHIHVSVFSEMELLSYSKITVQEEKLLKEYLNAVTIIGFTDQLKNRAIELRRKFNLKLLDAIIAATIFRIWLYLFHSR
ncbi:MAG: type II toxin-antitoxin system VapC family toxin [Balneola sp.]|nr:type II toxin-antitoxin system VapC family toxin [Balneola sp.]MBO6651416.1 type II toxin-antitoxin system VapC family toxin [Balneola sp.]MBO6800960.1 type II toxin-antitoxin system VapC family toxin [Balneola sp.]